jgi:CDP-6-deoxy-D-xylo-4-hexulose-3-dehydrase|tara:strand:+ start:2118 stop:3269 length:1152 start_codon:yes stop_codon:yes gene_type:complete
MKQTKKIWYAPYKFEAYGQEEIDAVVESLKSGWLGGQGPKSIEFEEKIAKRFGKKYGVFVNSGSSACLLAIAALDLPKGTKIITPSCTFATTVAPIIQLGYVPVFVDVDLTTYCANFDQIMAKITDDTSALMLPNLIGNKPDWPRIKKALIDMGREDIYLIEDSADTLTKTPETDVATTSFYASHVITAGGVGGMVMYNDKKHVTKCLQYRDWGRLGDDSEIVADRFNHVVDGIPYDHKFLYSVLGYHMKASEMNAAFGIVQLERFKTNAGIRRANFERYLENLKDVKELTLPDDSLQPNWLAIPFQTENRFDLLSFLEENNIQTRVTFAGNVTRHPVYREYLEDFKNADLIMKNGFLLGAHHGMTLEDVDIVCNKIKEFFNK